MQSSTHVLDCPITLICMGKKSDDLRDNLATNVRFLMADRGWNQVQTAKKAGVSQKSVSNILNRRKDAQLSVIEKLATAFGLSAWHLILPDLDKEIIGNGRVDRLLLDYMRASASGRDIISRIAEHEANYGEEPEHNA